MISSGLAVPALVACSAIAAVILGHAVYDLYFASKRRDNHRD